MVGAGRDADRAGEDRQLMSPALASDVGSQRDHAAELAARNLGVTIAGTPRSDRSRSMHRCARRRWQLTPIVPDTIVSDTLNTMLLRGNNHRHPANRRNINSTDGARSTSNDVPVTAATRQALERELASLRTEQREIPERLRVAREFGDTANNDEHLQIREEEAVLAARIARLESILLRATEVDDAGEPDSVTIGSVVTAVDVETGKTLEYAVGSAHGVLSRGTVSALSPIGRALLGRRVGDRVSVHLPRGRRRELKLRAVLQPQ